MNDHDPVRQPRQQPTPGRRGAGAAGGILAALAVAAAKFKVIVGLLLSFKWLLLAPKILLSFGSMFVSVWVFALLYGGLKVGIALVLLILVHELGHYVTFRNFGVPASLPMFIPGLGAFVAAPLTNDPARNAVAAIMGPVFGVLAGVACWVYGLQTQEPFWIGCAYIAFFYNLFNLIPVTPFDGGRVAGAIDSRLWLIGIVAFVAFIVYFRAFTAFSILILVLVGLSSLPRIGPALRGQNDPALYIVDPARRLLLAVCYFGLIVLVAIGAAHTAPEAAAIHGA